MTTWLEFRQCPGCGYDFVRDEGEKGCAYHDCPYLPPELDVLCPQCRFDFASGEGNPPCEDPSTCEHGEEARANVGNVRRWREALASR